MVTIDAKARMPSTSSDRYAISRRTLVAGLQFLGVNAPIPLYYVLGDLGVLTPAEVMHYGGDGIYHAGSYYLVSANVARRFDDVFGTTPAAMAA